MEITQLWMSQRRLRRAGQLPGLIAALHRGVVIPPIVLSRSEDDSLQVEDGHHRLAAVWLSGRSRLKKHEYLVIEKDQWRPRCGRIVDLIENMKFPPRW